MNWEMRSSVGQCATESCDEAGPTQRQVVAPALEDRQAAFFEGSVRYRSGNQIRKARVIPCSFVCRSQTSNSAELSLNQRWQYAGSVSHGEDCNECHRL